MQDISKSNPLIMNDKLYLTTKWAVQIAIPAFATLYFTLGDLWGWPNTGEVTATSAAICTFLGACLGISTHQYSNSDARFDGVMRVNKNEGRQLYDLELNQDPLNLAAKKEITFRVDKSSGKHAL